ncbi:hypothetical protein [Pararhizobium mangrovi]|uniref:Uncharacterized protein n=1 Tax=Pararhizobium mangrovi TaxID=2590452 RepID=A0A506UGR1_9HYPH|nr:hypothetical protein [Pararhizobium mangrovi]TPW32655.1 hypothetical protein FJU11_00025 [Pararhizobium mangrovi]
MRFVLSVIALVALVAAIATGLLDAVRSVAVGGVALTPIASPWVAAAPSSYHVTIAALAAGAPGFVAAGFAWLMAQPVIVPSAAIALAAYLAAVRAGSSAARGRPAGRSAWLHQSRR